MSAVASGWLQVGDRDNPLSLGNGEIATVTHNAGRSALFVVITGSNGQVIAQGNIDMTVNGSNSFSFQNNSGGPIIDINVFACFEMPTPDRSGFIPASDVVVV